MIAFGTVMIDLMSVCQSVACAPLAHSELFKCQRDGQDFCLPIANKCDGIPHCGDYISTVVVWVGHVFIQGTQSHTRRIEIKNIEISIQHKNIKDMARQSIYLLGFTDPTCVAKPTYKNLKLYGKAKQILCNPCGSKRPSADIYLGKTLFSFSGLFRAR